MQRHIREVVLECFKVQSKQADILVSEGAGGATDLTLLGVPDLANVMLSKLATTVILISLVSQGGALASLYGTISLMDNDTRSKLQGLGLNDVRYNLDAFTTTGTEIATKFDLDFIGSLPHLPSLNDNLPNSLSTTELNKKHDYITKIMKENINLTQILEWLAL